MDCDEVRDRLLEYRERQLDLPARTSLEAHLLVCESCLAALRDLEVLLAALSATRIPEPSPAAVERLRIRIAAERGSVAPRRLRWSWGWRPAAFATAALLAVVAGTAGWLVLPGPRVLETPLTRGAPAGPDLERSIAALAASLDGASMDAALGLWRAPFLEGEGLDALMRLMELSDRELEALLAQLWG